MHAGMKVFGDIATAEFKPVKNGGDYFTYTDKKNGDYVERVNNDFARQVLEDLYQVKEALKALSETKMALKHQALGMKVLETPEIAKMRNMLMKDLHVKSCEELKMKLMTTMV